MLTSMRELPMTIVEVISSAGKAVATPSQTIRTARIAAQKFLASCELRRTDCTEPLSISHCATRQPLSQGRTCVAAQRFSHGAIQQVIQRNLAGAKNQDQQANEKVNEGSGILESIGVGDESEQRLVISGPIRCEHVYRQAE